MYLGISEDVSRAKTNNSLKFHRAAPRLSAQMYLVLSKSGGGLSPKRGIVYLCSRLFYSPSLGTPGSRGCVFFNAPQSSDQTLCPQCRREAPRGVDPDAPSRRG